MDTHFIFSTSFPIIHYIWHIAVKPTYWTFTGHPIYNRALFFLWWDYLSNPWVVSTNYLKPRSNAVVFACLPCCIITTNHFLLRVSTYFSHASVSAISYYCVNLYMPVLPFWLWASAGRRPFFIHLYHLSA